MKKLLPVLLLVLSACSTTPGNVTRDIASTKRSVSSAEDDYKWVEGLDFDKKSEEKYRADKDEFDFHHLMNRHTRLSKNLFHHFRQRNLKMPFLKQMILL